MLCGEKLIARWETLRIFELPSRGRISFSGALWRFGDDEVVHGFLEAKNFKRSDIVSIDGNKT